MVAVYLQERSRIKVGCELDSYQSNRVVLSTTVKFAQLCQAFTPIDMQNGVFGNGEVVSVRLTSRRMGPSKCIANELFEFKSEPSDD